MRCSERLRDLRPDPQRVLLRQDTPPQTCGQSLAFQKLHHQVVRAVRLADVEEGGDVRVAKRRHRPRLAPETRQGVGVVRHVLGQDLDRHVAAQPRVARPIDLAHPTGTDEVRHLVRPEAPPSHDRELLRRCAQGRLLHQALRFPLVLEQRLNLAAQLVVSATRRGNERLPLRGRTLQRRVVQLLDLWPVAGHGFH